MLDVNGGLLTIEVVHMAVLSCVSHVINDTVHIYILVVISVMICMYISHTIKYHRTP